MLIVRVTDSPKVEVVEGDPYFLQMDFDSKEVWNLPPPIHPTAKAKYIFLEDAQVMHLGRINKVEKH